MADTRSTKRLRRTDEPDKVSFPPVYTDQYGPFMKFDLKQARAWFSLDSSFTCTIGEAIILARIYGHWDIQQYLEPLAHKFLRSRRISDDGPRLLEIYTVFLAFHIGRPVYEVNTDGRLRPCKLRNVRVLKETMTFRLSYQHKGAIVEWESVDFRNLHSKSGTSLYFDGQLECEGMPQDWLLNWEYITYGRPDDFEAATTLPRGSLAARNGVLIEDAAAETKSQSGYGSRNGR